MKAWDVGCECLPPAVITDVITANHDERILSYYYVKSTNLSNIFGCSLHYIFGYATELS